jgi:hypothetical protein
VEVVAPAAEVVLAAVAAGRVVEDLADPVAADPVLAAIVSMRQADRAAVQVHGVKEDAASAAGRTVAQNENAARKIVPKVHREKMRRVEIATINAANRPLARVHPANASDAKFLAIHQAVAADRAATISCLAAALAVAGAAADRRALAAATITFPVCSRNCKRQRPIQNLHPQNSARKLLRCAKHGLKRATNYAPPNRSCCCS